MRTANVVVLVTCASRKEAEGLARAVVEKKLAACVNVATVPVKSVYRWKGKIEMAEEFPLVIKTARRKFGALEKEIRRLHSYEAPEIVAVPIVAGSAAYLRWIAEAVGA
ncbi:MAG TPA: divalent-cation tolerance protein CutA [Verrucomicrobiae bacterium]|nr:divalent-cation tolerance protein CutA [Verrucomicrobiae bacterium]